MVSHKYSENIRFQMSWWWILKQTTQHWRKAMSDHRVKPWILIFASIEECLFHLTPSFTLRSDYCISIETLNISHFTKYLFRECHCVLLLYCNVWMQTNNISPRIWLDNIRKGIAYMLSDLRNVSILTSILPTTWAKKEYFFILTCHVWDKFQSKV